MVEEFFIYLETEKRFSQHTITAYDNDIRSFLTHCDISSISQLNEISYQHIRSWIVELVNSNHSKKSINRKLSSLRTFFKWAQKNDLVDSNPCVRIKGLKQEKRIPEFIKEEELDTTKMETVFPENFSGLRDRLMIEVLYQTGIRLTELINLKKNDVSSENIKVLGKRNKERYIPITNELYSAIESYLNMKDYLECYSDYLFLTDKGRKLYPKFVYRKVHHYLSLLTHLKKRSPHILRHTFATHMLNNGSGLETLKELLGHSNLSATQIYTHNSFDQISTIYKQAHPRGNKKSE